MKIETSVRYIVRLKTVIADCYSAAKIYHMSHEQLMKWEDDHLYNHPEYQRLPRWAKAELRGYLDAKRHELYTYHLEWRVRLNGNLIKGSDVPNGKWGEVEKGDFVYTDAPERVF